jgi:Sec-independent protein secretion pathway component TatC
VSSIGLFYTGMAFAYFLSLGACATLRLTFDMPALAAVMAIT